MKRVPSFAMAFAALALTAGLAWAHAMPVASNGGLSTARDASGKSVPMAFGAGGAHGTITADQAPPDLKPADVPPADRHGATVSAAAQADTPSSFKNHGAYVSSVAKGWGQQTAAANRTTPAPIPEPAMALDGLPHQR
jgi:hypothetical protein